MRSTSTNHRVSAIDRVVRQVKERIGRGDYPPHSYLPSEREFALELSVGRNTVSAALTRLTEEGYVVKTKGRGTRVLPHQERLARKQLAIVHAPTNLGSPAAPTEPARVLAGVCETFARFGYAYQLVVSENSHGSAQSLAGRFGGLIFLESMGCERQILELERQRIPLVVANLETQLDVTATWVNHGKASAKAVEVLSGLAHRRIAFIGRDPARFFYGQARDGYLAGLAAAGIPPDDALIMTCEPDPLSAYFTARPLFGLPDPPTAFVAARDVFAQGVCRAATEAGLVVGRDVSVIGFDDVSWPEPNPVLTTFHEPCRELGAVAAEMLIDRTVNGWRPPEKREIDAPLIFRLSAGPLIPAGQLLSSDG